MKDTEHNNSSNEEEQTEGLNSNREHKIPDIESVEKESKDTAIDNKSAESPVVDDKFKSSLIDLSPVTIKVEQIRSEMERFIIGQHEMIDLLLIGVFTGGHILLEGVPGVAKTLSARVMAKTISSEFSRIQFTPDMMPSDIIGTSVFNMKTSDFMFKKGPIFTNIVLIDEINRSPAKTQAALFEVMEEKQITYDGTTYPMEFPFLVVADRKSVV